jgi:probable rRNA maturation factor
MSSPQLELLVDDDVPSGWNETQIRDVVQRILSIERPGLDYTISIHLVSDERIRELNAQHRGIDKPTDVLSFPLGDDFVLPPGERVHLGDVVVSYPRAVEQAREYGHSLERELAYLVAHGVLHVLGHDHEGDAERQRMRQREEEALAPLGLIR